MLKALFYWWNINITLPAWCYSDISKREDTNTATQQQQSNQPLKTNCTYLSMNLSMSMYKSACVTTM